MPTVLVELTVFFDDPFWVGVFERRTGGGLEAARMVFGAEPKDSDVYRLVLDAYASLPYSAAIADGQAPRAHTNPKRVRREAGRRLEAWGVGTKAQEALKAQQQQGKAARRTQSREAREAEQERKFSLKQAKRRQKHLGH